MLKLQFRDKSKPDLWLVDSLVTIGSDKSCNVIIKGSGVAPLHAELHIKDNLVDLEHKGGSKVSYVNDAMIASTIRLKAWDVIRIGSTELELVDPLLNRSPRKKISSQATQVRELVSDWMLQAQTAPFSGQLFPITKVLTIGRDSQCEIAVPMPHVSRKHAQVMIFKGQPMIKDLASANGTYVNDEAIESITLKNGDEIRVDNFKFKVLFTGEVEQVKPPSQTQLRTGSSAKKQKQDVAAKYPTPESVPSIPLDQFQVAFFHGKSESIRGKVYKVTAEGSQIGRMLGHHLSRDDTSVAARHVDINLKGRFWNIKNNGAANGLLVNGRMTTRATLVDGDEVTIGGLDLIFQSEGSKPRKIIFDDDQNTIDFGRVAITVAIIGVLFITAVAIISG
ncbi:MAG: FHA domain-containing protein [Kangiellaceae bacterium]|jgi:pSer/pThr/pTyr-binding forkhead associated (FHA) protein|nr:FHA domain-containing protein [Kangiellaceae bacterium]